MGADSRRSEGPDSLSPARRAGKRAGRVLRPNGATDSSQGREPLETDPRKRPSPNGATPHVASVAPLGLRHCGNANPDLTVWATTCRPVGAKKGHALPNTRSHLVAPLPTDCICVESFSPPPLWGRSAALRRRVGGKASLPSQASPPTRLAEPRRPPPQRGEAKPTPRSARQRCNPLSAV
jgi:hypothetical protein